ncbi:MAG: sulfite exporter TauE/SafE family protein [bacterium]
MSNDIYILSIAAVSIGFLHTVFGPDHYLPFIVMSRARSWSLPKTLLITFFCGIGHIASSVIIGLIGISLGIAVMKVEAFEIFRGNLAAWLLIGFGLAYTIWGIHQAIKNKPHSHLHAHGEDDFHHHSHAHSDNHVHVHDKLPKKNITPWVLFTIFIFGPCEPLIPILMYPAAKINLLGLLLVTLLFGTATIGTMLSIVTASSFGIQRIPLGRFERFTHALAGSTILASGLAIQFLGL